MSYPRENLLPFRYHEPPPFHYGGTQFHPPHHPSYHDEPRENRWDEGTTASGSNRSRSPESEFYAREMDSMFPFSSGYLANYYKDSSSSNRAIPNLYPIEAFTPAALQFAAPHPFLYHPHYQNTHPAHAAPTLRHILTHYQPPNHNPNWERRERDAEAVSSDNGIINLSKPPVSRKKPVKTRGKSSSDADCSGQSDTIEKRVDSPKPTIPLTPRKSRIAWKKRYYAAIAAQTPPPESTSSSSSLSSDGTGSEEPEPNPITSPKELDLSLKKKVPKRKQDINHHPEVANVAIKKSEIPVPNKKFHLLSKDHENKEWIKKGVAVKSIQHDRPLGTIMGVNKDKSICTLQFFRGWKAEIQTKFIIPVLSGEND